MSVCILNDKMVRMVSVCTLQGGISPCDCCATERELLVDGGVLEKAEKGHFVLTDRAVDLMFPEGSA